MARDWEPGQRRSKKPTEPHATTPSIPNPAMGSPTEGLPTAHTTTPNFGPRDLPTQTGPGASFLDLWQSVVNYSEDAYVKAGIGNDGKSVYYTYKWHRGPWRGYYVMAVVSRGDDTYALSLLYRKVAEVYRGERKPTLDKPPKS